MYFQVSLYISVFVISTSKSLKLCNSQRDPRSYFLAYPSSKRFSIIINLSIWLLIDIRRGIECIVGFIILSFALRYYFAIGTMSAALVPLLVLETGYPSMETKKYKKIMFGKTSQLLGVTSLEILRVFFHSMIALLCKQCR